jgi:hypothetical protein
MGLGDPRALDANSDLVRLIRDCWRSCARLWRSSGVHNRLQRTGQFPWRGPHHSEGNPRRLHGPRDPGGRSSLGYCISGASLQLQRFHVPEGSGQSRRPRPGRRYIHGTGASRPADSSNSTRSYNSWSNAGQFDDPYEREWVNNICNPPHPKDIMMMTTTPSLSLPCGARDDESWSPELNSSWSLSGTRFWLLFRLHAVLVPVPQENSSSLIIDWYQQQPYMILWMQSCSSTYHFSAATL